MLHREERGGGGKSQLEEAVGQLTDRLEGFIYSFQAGKRMRTLSQLTSTLQSTCERIASQILCDLVLLYCTVQLCISRMFFDSVVDPDPHS